MDVWTGIWNSIQHITFTQDPYVWKFYKLLLGNYRFKGKKVLEIGSGTGINTALMARQGAKVVFFDQSHAALDLARKTMELWGLDGEYVKGDAFDYSFKQEFDLVHSEGVVEHFLSRRRQEILEVHAGAAKRGGKVLIIVPHAGCMGYRIGKRLAQATGTWLYGGEYPYTARELGARMKLAGVPVRQVVGGELLFGMGWLFCPLWLRSRSMLARAIAMPANERMFALNYNNRFASTWGRVIGCVGTKV